MSLLTTISIVNVNLLRIEFVLIMTLLTGKSSTE